MKWAKTGEPVWTGEKVIVTVNSESTLRLFVKADINKILNTDGSSDGTYVVDYMITRSADNPDASTESSATDIETRTKAPIFDNGDSVSHLDTIRTRSGFES